MFGYLHARGHPDAVHGDINGGDEDGDGDLEAAGFALVGEEDRDAVDDDLKEELHLKGPCCYCACEVSIGWTAFPETEGGSLFMMVELNVQMTK